MSKATALDLAARIRLKGSLEFASRKALTNHGAGKKVTQPGKMIAAVMVGVGMLLIAVTVLQLEMALMVGVAMLQFLVTVFAWMITAVAFHPLPTRQPVFAVGQSSFPPNLTKL